MKKLLVFALILSAQFMAAQVIPEPDAPPTPEKQIEEEDNHIYATYNIDALPKFPGGLEKFMEFFYANFKMPEGEVLKGKIFVNFTIKKDGTLSDILVARDLGLGSGKETIRVLKLSPKWIPGKKHGKNVLVVYPLEFEFGNTTAQKK